jgi:hypothetical protein
MHERTPDPLAEFDIREPLDTSAPETGVHHPWFVLSSGSMHPDVYWARRRRARAAAIVIVSMLAIGSVAALLIFQRQASYVWTLIEPTPQPTSIAEVETPPELPPVAAAPSTGAAAPVPKAADPVPPPAVVDVAPIPPAPSTPQAEPSRAPVIPHPTRGESCPLRLRAGGRMLRSLRRNCFPCHPAAHTARPPTGPELATT